MYFILNNIKILFLTITAITTTSMYYGVLAHRTNRQTNTHALVNSSQTLITVQFSNKYNVLN